MILSDREIGALLDNGLIVIKPRPSPELWTSTAIDLTLDNMLMKWLDPESEPTGRHQGPREVWPLSANFNIRKMMEQEGYAQEIEIPERGYPLDPCHFILGYTSESIYLPQSSRIAARVEGKSSLARLGVGVHVTAPTIHAGFGYHADAPGSPGSPIQLEIFNLGVFRVYLQAGMPICQLILEEVREAPSQGYLGQFSAQQSFRTAPERKSRKKKQ